mmetsp:Transcript_6224/g.12412  ORF Transcript_6224/g.12412 Transcript_6224/m.12412 type:complete len:208 (+) Transcript_6224:32-655(+)|eukprot:CAMPEP_0119061972 /NCGR_PEP_ID=MMETSP1178-20130426/5664_1 /TAXON_ID=33656 /ORGANISM="unid sp, Strain CCMP2000" /LENGTH=207 /DNA_ID=CAMNT_0007043211 /DNA_START=32 /DNA_END=655 /DNA_ORIENTATION=+
MRRAVLAVGASASAVGCALAGQSKAVQAQEAQETPKYGWEGSKVNYGGAGDVKPGKDTKRLVSHMSTVPDEWELFRVATRASIILDKLNEADAEIAKRPETLKIKALEGVDLSAMIDKACHRQSIIEWKAYAQCAAKKSAGGHEGCTGWWQRYQHAIEKCSYKNTLKVLQSMTEDDPDPNVRKTAEEGGWSFLPKTSHSIFGGPDIK